MWGGSRAQAGKLKKLVTELTHDIEHKFGARFSVESFLNVIFASNERWVVPVGFKGRRWCCLDLLNNRAGINNAKDNAAYFKQLRDVDVAAFAEFLLSRDISDFNPRNVPTTSMLRDQKRRRFDAVAAWWDDLLTAGELVVPYDQIDGSQPNIAFQSREWGRPIANNDLFAMYKKHKGSNRGIDRCSDLLRELRSLCTFGNDKKKQLRIQGKREYVTLLPTLEQARQYFCAKVDDPNWFDN